MHSQKTQNDLCSFPRQTLNVTLIQVYAPTNNAEEAEIEQFYEDLQDLLELTPKRDVLSIIGTGMQISKSRDTWFNTQIWA